MRYDPIPNSLFVENRIRFCREMDGNSLAILVSNDVQHTNADDEMGFAQNNDLFYLSGIDQEDSILVLYPQAYVEENREILFLKEPDAHSTLWEGKRLTKQEARQISGIKRVEWIDDFERILQLMAFEADQIYLGHNEHIKRLTSDRETAQDRMIGWCRRKYPLHDLKRAARITRQLRPVKSEIEINLIAKAVEISVDGFSRVIEKLKPGIKEYEIEADLSHSLISKGGLRPAFKPIVASGLNACVLHYTNNADLCKDGDMVLVDFGVCHANYNSDVTRCFPVNGEFSPRQRAVYSSVLHCLKEGSKLLRPGMSFREYNTRMTELVEEQLIVLGVLKAGDISSQDPDNPLYRKYFMHGTCHYLGLDVHDVGLYSRDMEKGMVLTCEPGIYLPDEGIGCRLENDYLITEEGNLNLSQDIPIEPEEIEMQMSKRG